MFTVYVLRNPQGKRYIGQTSDLDRRLAQHNDPDHNPRSFITRNPGPWVLVHSEEYETRPETVRRERWLKSGIGREWLDREIARL